MKKLLFLVFLASLVLFAFTVYTQRLESPIRVYSPGLETPVKIALPDFSGTWKLNPAKSGLPKASGMSDLSLLLIVEQKLPAIIVAIHVIEDDEDSTLGTITFYTDGRGDEFPDVLDSNYSTTRWQGNKLAITIFSSKSRQEVSAITELELSPDGNTLMCRSNRTKIRQGPNGERIKYVDYINTEFMSFGLVPDIPAKSVRPFDREEQ